MRKAVQWFVWSVIDVLTGRRKHWNLVCVPVFLQLAAQVESLERPLRDITRLLLASSWTAFRGDFSRGAFRRWQKSLDRERTRNLLAIYLSYLIELCLNRQAWDHLGASRETIWSTVFAFLPEARKVKGQLAGLDGGGLASELSRLHLTLLSVVDRGESTGEDFVTLCSSHRFFVLRTYHPALFSRLCETICSRLSGKSGASPDPKEG